MVSLDAVSVSFGAQDVLRTVSLTIGDRDHVTIVGANGSGKTTLLRVITGEQEVDAGTRTTSRGLTIAHLAQHLTTGSDVTVWDLAESGFAREHALDAQRQRLADTLATTPDDAATLHEMAEIADSLDRRGYHQRGQAIGMVLDGLGFAVADRARLVGEFSGGWRMRAHLARVLLERPDLLLLDEPTNYLDTESRTWLIDYLRAFSSAFVVVAHDRAFLDAVVETTYEVFNGEVRRYAGGYTAYERARAVEVEALIQAKENQERERARLEAFINRFRATATKARQVQSRVTELARMTPIEVPMTARTLSVPLPAPPDSGRIMCETTELTLGYGDRTVVAGVTVTIARGERVALVGRNGAGKTTFLRGLVGRLAPQSGTHRLGSNVLVGYYAQESAEELPPTRSIREYVESVAFDPARVRDLLGAFLFSGDAIDKPIGVLSGGERARVALAAMLAQPANLLVLDEPTNHLDIASQDALSGVLSRYAGSLIVVSHDRDFLRRVTTRVIALWPQDADGAPPRRWIDYAGGFRDFEGSAWGPSLERHIDSSQERPRNGTNTPRSPSGDGEAAGGDYATRKATRARLRKLERREEELLAEIDRTEQAIAAREAELASEAVYSDGEQVKRILAEVESLRGSHGALHEAWEELAAELQSIAE